MHPEELKHHFITMHVRLIHMHLFNGPLIYQARTDALVAGGAVREPPGVTLQAAPPPTKPDKLKAGTTEKSLGGFEYVCTQP
jgi:hypothetical protein